MLRAEPKAGARAKAARRRPIRSPRMRGIVAVAGIIGVIAIASCTATSSSSGAKQNSPAAADTSVAAGKPKPQTLLKLKGSGTKTTQKFTAAGDWDLDWSYDCSGFGAQGNFQVFVYDSAGGISE